MRRIKYIVNKTILKIINIVQYPVLEILARGKTIPIRGRFDRYLFKVKKNNFGDDLNVFFIEKITNKRVIKSEYSLAVKLLNYESYAVIGSILEFVSQSNKKYIVWGSGFKYSDSIFSTKNIANNKYLAVRGKKTRDRIVAAGGVCPEIYGDPVLLLSKYYTINNVRKKYLYGIIPHKLDSKNPIVREISQRKDVLMIDIEHYENVESFLMLINECNYVLSSSLHGLIIADSYKIPNLWVRFSNFIDGNGFKFEDYYSGIGRTAICYDLSDGISDKLIQNELSKWKEPKIDPMLENSCPFLS